MKVQNLSSTVADIPDGALLPGETGDADEAEVRNQLDAGVLAKVDEHKTSSKKD